jgi:chaperonin GroEL
MQKNNRLNVKVDFGLDALNKMKEGVDTLANAVKITLGPRGRNAAIERNYGPPLITKDGVTVAKSIFVKDNVENMGAQLVKYVANNTNNWAGDGTTSATVLSQAIFNSGLKFINHGHNPVLIKRGIDSAAEIVLSKLEDLSRSLSTEQEIKNVAEISLNNDRELSELISKVIIQIGNDGIISVEEATGSKTDVTYTSGIKLDRGYLSPVFVNTVKDSAEFEDCYVMVYDGSISLTKDIMAYLQNVSQEGKPILIIANDVTSDALDTLVLNNSRGALKSCAIKSPGFGDIRRDLLEDICCYSGATLISTQQELQEGRMDLLGKIRKVSVNRNNTSLIEGYSKDGAIEERIKNLKEQMDQEGIFDYQIASIRERVSQLSDSVAILRVGGTSEAEMRERKDRIEDAINAVKAAIDEGIITGGGTGLLHCYSHLKENTPEDITVEEKAGYDIVLNALKAPFIQILTNAGQDYHLIMEKLIYSENKDNGFNALTMKFVEDMYEEGVIDPLKVVKTGFRNAISASSTLLTTGVSITRFGEESNDT